GARLLPSSYCYYGHPEFADTLSVFPDSNGSSSGNTLEEAFMQGFMELVERDAVAIWFYNRIRRVGIDISSFKMPYLDALQDFYRSIGRDIWVIDITSDLPIPVFACVSRRTSHPVEDIILGFGAHFDPRIALLRSITEVNQFLPSLMIQQPDGSTNYLFGDALARHWWKTARLEDNEYLLPDSERPHLRMGDIQDLSSDDLLDDVNTCLDLCRERDMDVYFLDQTRPDIQLSVVKIVVPQLCHFWRRFGKERLWQVPVEQGWLARANTAETCNPYTIFF
ncbi:MAG: YcaO-like family protein, partial [Myxococcota bacterium]